MQIKEIRLGSRVKCKVTNFVGIVTGKVEYLNGCIQYNVQPQMTKKEKECPKSRWIDAEQLVILGKGISIKKTIGGKRYDSPMGNYSG